MRIEHSKYLRLQHILREMDSVVVTFSGGVDSALLSVAAHHALGPKSIALTAVSPTFPPEELQTARALASEQGFSLVEVDSHELSLEGYAQNQGNRCYFCKSELFELAGRYAKEMGFRWVVDGTIVDDLGSHRPGLDAAKEQEVRHPLVEAGFTKEDVREVAKSLGISAWSKPSFACLGSRFPVGTRVELDKLRRVSKAETALRERGFQQFRVRWHELGNKVLARIELSSDEIERAAGERDQIVTQLQALGFDWVTLDLVGYRGA